MNEVSEQVSLHLEGGRTVIRLSGEVDILRSPDMEAVGRRAIDRGRPITVDVTEVTFVDSIGVAFVARLAAAEISEGRRLTVLGSNAGFRAVLRVGGLSDHVDLRDAPSPTPGPPRESP